MKDKRNTQQVVDRITEIRQELCTSIQNKGVECPPETKFQDLHLKIDEIQQARINGEEVEAKGLGIFQDGDFMYTHKRSFKMEETGTTYKEDDILSKTHIFKGQYNDIFFLIDETKFFFYKLDIESNNFLKIAEIEHLETSTVNFSIIKKDDDYLRILVYRTDLTYRVLSLNLITYETKFSHAGTLSCKAVKATAYNPKLNKSHIISIDNKLYEVNFVNGLRISEKFSTTKTYQQKRYSVYYNKNYIIVQFGATELFILNSKYEILKEVNFKTNDITNIENLVITDHFILFRNGKNIYSIKHDNLYLISSLKKITNVDGLVMIDDYSFITVETDGTYIYYLDETSINFSKVKVSEKANGELYVIDNNVLKIPSSSSYNNIFKLTRERITRKVDSYGAKTSSIAIALQPSTAGEIVKIKILSRYSDDIE